MNQDDSHYYVTCLKKINRGRFFLQLQYNVVYIDKLILMNYSMGMATQCLCTDNIESQSFHTHAHKT